MKFWSFYELKKKIVATATIWGNTVCIFDKENPANLSEFEILTGKFKKIDWCEKLEEIFMNLNFWFHMIYDETISCKNLCCV